MTIIWQQPPTDTGQTHVLIIGVGYYHHLRLGEGQRVDDDMGLGQLKSPPISAGAFAKWLINNFENEDTPLGSVEILLSEGSEYTKFSVGSSSFSVESATLYNIETAFYSWYKRCNSNSKNIAILYFCGHGVTIQGDSILLAEDFGSNRLHPYKNAINIDKLYKGMSQCQARTQCFFIDACRSIPVSGLSLEDANAACFISPRLKKPAYEHWKLLFYASARGSSANADNATEVSRFTKALIESLDGVASYKEERRWIVTTSSLVHSVKKIMKRQNLRSNGLPQEPSVGNEDGLGHIIVRRRPPVVPITLKFEPLGAMAEARLLLQCPNNPSWFIKRDSISEIVDNPHEWEVRVEADADYHLIVHFPSGRYKNIQQQITVVMSNWHKPDPIPVEPLL